MKEVNRLILNLTEDQRDEVLRWHKETKQLDPEKHTHEVFLTGIPSEDSIKLNLLTVRK